MQAAAVSETAPREPFGLESLFLQHQRRVFRAAYRITGSAQDAEDVLQTVFLRLARQGGERGALANPSSYLYRAAINAALDLLRARRERADRGIEEAAGTPSPAPRPDELHDEQALRAWLRRALLELPPRAALVFALRHLEGQENGEIARALGISRVLVAVTLHRTRRRLQKQFRETRGRRP